MGSFSTNAYGEGRYYTFTYSTSQDQVKNTTTLNWTLSCAGGVSWYAERTLILTIDGSNVVSKTDRVARYAGNIASGSKTFTHDADGNKSISVKIQAAVETSSITCSGSSTITLSSIELMISSCLSALWLISYSVSSREVFRSSLSLS